MPPLPPKAGEKSPAQPSKNPENFEVIASRPGFFQRTRIDRDEKFICPSLEMAGDWMDATDPVINRQLKAFLKAKSEAFKTEYEKKDKDAGL